MVNDMKAEIHSIVTSGGGQATDLEESLDESSVEVLGNGNVVVTLRMADYWKFFEKGRGAGKMPPSKPIEDWIKSRGLKVELTIKKKPRKRGISKVQRTLSYDKKVRGLAFVIRRSIGKKGIKPRPFFDKVFNQGRVNQLKEMLAPVMREEFIIELKK